MGNCVRMTIEELSRRRCSEKTIVLLITGLDNSGKTMVLNRISGDPSHIVFPTIGFRTVSLKYKSCKIKVYDLGGGPQIRSIWKKYYSDVHGVIYVVDASDLSRLSENREVFSELITHEHVSGKPLLLLANKQDLRGAMDELDIVDKLDVEELANSMRCPTRVEICSSIYTDLKGKEENPGISEGYRWLLETILKDYNNLNNRIKKSEIPRYRKLSARSSVLSKAGSANPFKPIREFLKERNNSVAPAVQ
ncbi:ADP-ribosylation factor-like protein 13B [Belonocnema kinseyi]|uniref:ADP-ribosylation factor-like protein 13B n=1 Tax=Belonocnema kinseyi TaxID=2817044 RepID=UPI00143D4BCD|nr:ADP-ribosylation factor-like protein 13B [Belonocnema kinseyi]